MKEQSAAAPSEVHFRLYGPTKCCKVCRIEKPLADFYVTRKVYLQSHCKSCNVAKSRESKRRNLESTRASNLRSKRRPESREIERLRNKTEHGRALRRETYRRYNAAFPERREARIKVMNALQSGEIKPQPCWVCGARAEAHHPDYSRPIDVVWLCRTHHREAHALARALKGDA